MTPAAWIALAFGAATLVINLIALVRHYTKLEGRIAAMNARMRRLSRRMKSIQRSIDHGKVVVFRGPQRLRQPDDKVTG